MNKKVKKSQQQEKMMKKEIYPWLVPSVMVGPSRNARLRDTAQ